MQLVVSLAVLLLCFIVAGSCTFLIIMTLQLKKKKAVAQRTVANTITPENTSTNSTIKMKHARPSPEGGKRESPQEESPQRRIPYTVNYGTVEPGSLETSETKDATEHGPVIFVDSSNSRGAPPGQQGNETTPLLPNEDAASMGDFEFGSLSEASGVWHRDLAGRHIIRFVVLLLLLVFSSLVVSLHVQSWVEMSYHPGSWYYYVANPKTTSNIY